MIGKFDILMWAWTGVVLFIGTIMGYLTDSFVGLFFTVINGYFVIGGLIYILLILSEKKK